MLETEKINEENEKKRVELKNAYMRLFKTKDGKEVLADLRNFCGQDRTSICEHSPNPYQTFGAEGRRRVWLRIAAMRKKEKVKENE
ncbi:hypothetical protein LCGC14_1679600 [marine sediment metagenome]|uniref:Bbp19-like phage domain-containing protein n=1 Tax=marine sediment metagenome TaxID=412755 RepID=A0A0F9K4U3_9ZZZZ|nr:hypothetical protein [Pricia sp.]